MTFQGHFIEFMDTGKPQQETATYFQQ